MSTSREIEGDTSGRDESFAAEMRDIAADWASWTRAERLLATALTVLFALVLPFAFLLDGALG